MPSMKAEAFVDGAHNENSPAAPVRLNFDLVLLVEPEKLLSERRLGADQTVYGVMPVAAQHEARGLVVVEEADDDAVADLDLWKYAS